MGFDGLFFGRLDYADKEKRMETNTMEMVWAADETDKTGDSDLFTGALFHAYSPPPGNNIIFMTSQQHHLRTILFLLGFCFDSLCRDVIMDDQRMEDYNFDRKVIYKLGDFKTVLVLYFRCLNLSTTLTSKPRVTLQRI